MNKALKKKWVDALRSGKYKQGKTALRVGNNFCCLGVLCDVIDPKRWVSTPDCDHFKWDVALANVPNKTRKAIHLNHTDAHKLMYLNDGEGKNFNEIADYIESNIKEDK